MIFTAPKIIAGIISTVWAFTTFLGVVKSLPEANSNLIPDAYYQAVLPSTTTVAPTTTITTIATCDDALQLALNLGFPADQLGVLDLVMHRESRCQPTAHNTADPNGGSYGLTQINGFWCLPNSRWPIGWLQEKGILDDCSDLFNATIALRSTLAIYNNSGWTPWATAK